ncbi:hypothetical protein WA158_000566 [Blastocystis sp. Blastoise]
MVSVWFFAANLIGYFRIITGILAFYYRTSNPLYFCVLYFVSYLADAFDGTAARALHQCSQFGACLDMTTDRFCTAALLCVLSNLYPDQAYIFICLMILDIVSHWTQMFASSNCGMVSHKAMTKKDNVLLRLYYNNRIVLFTVCFMNEAYFVCKYILATINHPTMAIFAPYDKYFTIFMQVCFPVFVFKQITSILAYIGACKRIVHHDQEQIKNKKH